MSEKIPEGWKRVNGFSIADLRFAIFDCRFSILERQCYERRNNGKNKEIGNKNN